MATSLLSAQYEFNGVVSTDKSVLKNLQDMCTACGSWLTYDIHEGLWAVVINQTGESVASFDDSNIIGALTVQGTGLDQLTDHCIVNFPHIDINDNRDFIRIDIAEEDHFPNEISRPVTIESDLFNDPIQAQLLGLIELKQRRVDRVVRFTTDFSMIGLKAGDLIDITNSIYGYESKMFRIISINEADADNGSINLDITALEYDEDVYNTDDLSRYTITNETGIVSLGNISAPGTPTVTKYEFDARPRLVITSTVPTYGSVTGMEFWYTEDVPPAVTIDANRTYKLLGTTLANANTVLTPGATITTDQDSFGNISLLVKTRGINAQTSGPFSEPSGSVTNFTPVQATQAISDSTQVSNTGTGSLLTALALTTLLKNVDGLFNSNSAISQAAGGLYDKMFKVFNANTGYDLTGNAGNLNTLTSNTNNIMISAASGQFTESSIPQTSSNSSSPNFGPTITFTPPVDGTYKIDVLADQNSSGARGGRGKYTGYAVRDLDGVNNLYGITSAGVSAGSSFDPSDVTQRSFMYLYEPEDHISVLFALQFASNSADICVSGSGGIGALPWTDFFMSNTANLSAGTSYTLKFYCTNYTRSNPTATASFDIGYNVYTVK